METKKVKIKKLILKGFRGAKKEIWLNFESENKSIVLFGNNGDGKSSFSDGIEWLFTDKIDYLQREGCGRDDYFNRYMSLEDDAKVEINFNNNLLNSQKILIRKGGSLFSNTTNGFKNYLKDSSKESFILRHHTMREFIDKTKKEKLEHVEEIIGFNIVKEIRDTLLKSLNALKDDRELASLQGQVTEKRRDLVGIILKEDFGKVDVLNYANQIIKECDPNLFIVNYLDFEPVVENLDKKIKASDRGKELSKLDDINESLSKLSTIKNILHETSDILTRHNELAKQREIIKASAIEKLYSAAIEAIENKLVEDGKCPICKKPIDTEDLVKSLSGEIEEIKMVLKERNQVIQDATSISDKVIDLQPILSVLLENDVKTKFLTDKTSERFTDINTLILKFVEILDKVLKTPDAVSIPLLDTLQNLEEDVKETQQKIHQRKEGLDQTDEEKRFYQNVDKLKKLYNDYARYNEISNFIDIYNEQKDSLDKICQDFENMERESVQKVLKTISSDVNDFLKFLHPDDNFDKVELIPTEERGVEFKLKYHGEEVSPPMKILSEAHLNSLGICLFLASAKHFNKTNGFLVLDDVVTSFDTNHRRPLARLLSEKLSDVQFLLFTHDELWFEILKKDLPHVSWFFKELMKWTKDDGIDIKDSPMMLKERIKYSLDTNDISGATNKCRILIEEILKEKCENLGVRGLVFKTGYKNDQRGASELINALTSYLKENETLCNKLDKILFSHLRASQLITNIGSHHNTLNTTSLSRGDIETVLHDIDEFESLFICPNPNCATEPNINYSPQNSKMKQCKCGKLWI